MQSNNDALILREYLEDQYRNIFDSAAIEAHIRDYVGFAFSDSVAPLVAKQIPRGSRVLDIGCGFGSFVISARRLGLEAIGLEIAHFEVEYAKRRLARELPNLDPDAVYYLGDGLNIPFGNASFDAITLWNVLEHVPDGDLLLKEAVRLLRPDGKIFLICPNYAAFRREAHYLVPWFPLFPRKLASIYLKLCGKDPRFFETSIFYRTNWEVQRTLKRLGMQVGLIGGPPAFDPAEIDLFVKNTKERISEPERTRNAKIRKLLAMLKRLHLERVLSQIANVAVVFRHVMPWWSVLIYKVRLYNPFMDSVILSARKEAGQCQNF